MLVKFMQRTYQEMFSHQDFSHLAVTVEQYFSTDTPLWWVDEEAQIQEADSKREITQSPIPSTRSPVPNPQSPIACLWIGNAIDQITSDRHAHIFLLYVSPTHRRRGIATALMRYVENWAKQKGDIYGKQIYRQISLQVFESNTPAIELYHHLGYQTQSLWMVKSLH
jgi:ribosomal protein S18 acetylase RimI-like enzyme